MGGCTPPAVCSGDDRPVPRRPRTGTCAWSDRAVPSSFPG
ncbi:hypothetical protein BURCENBC7_AP3186 [Burkholderia cenocepacia BC7]|nr:hypothetical protein BURCENK562V_C3142 [Burkholderia cenocepacia K56-2Valvano]ERI31545.1 hypothetical protein BURCENBC7_AP3186 [Burkholderia cenocepacia BC7]